MANKISISRRFAIVDEWVINLDISDRAFKLYAVLARFADNNTHKAFPSRETLATRLRCSKASVDRAVTELIDAKAIEKRHRAYNSVLYTVLVDAPEGVITHEYTMSSPVITDVVTRDDVTITTELEPNNYIGNKAKQLPNDWEPSPDFANECAKKFPLLDIKAEAEGFVDHHAAKGSTFKDFNAAFRTWCRNAVKFHGPKTIIHKQELKPAAEGPQRRAWAKAEHDRGDHWACEPGEFGCK